MADVEDRLKDPWFVNWVKCASVLGFARDAIIQFVEEKNQAVHKTILSQLPGACSSPSVCSFKNRNRCHVCETFKKEIKAAHRFNRPSYGNTCIQDCLTNPWEFAKCYMSPNGYIDIHCASATDITGLISVIINNTEFQQYTSEDLTKSTNIFCKAKEVRNRTMHNPELELDEQTLQTNSCDIKMMLKKVPQTNDTRVAISKINELLNGTMTITTATVVELMDQANMSLKVLDQMIQIGLKKISEITEMCNKKIEEETAKGVGIIDAKVSEGTGKLEKKTATGVAKIQNVTEKGSKIIDDKTKSASTNISFKKQESLDQIHSEADKIKEEITAKDMALKRDHDQLQNTVEEGMCKLGSKVKEIIENKEKTQLTAEELERKTELLDNRLMQNAQKLKNVTEACMQQLLTETETFSQIIKSRTEQDGLDEKIKHIQAKLENLESTVNENQETFVQLDNIDVRGDNERKACMISDVILMDKELLAIADHRNSSVKVINVTRNIITTQVKLPIAPWHITCAESHQLVVSCDDKLQYLQLNDNLSIAKKSLKLRGSCRGVDYSDHKFVVCLSMEEPVVDIIDTNGSVLKSIKLLMYGLSSLFSVKFGTDKQTIYISARTMPGSGMSGKVLSLNLDGVLQHVYTDDKLKQSCGLAVGQYGTLYISDFSSNNVHHITENCKRIMILADETRGNRYQRSIAYNKTVNRLYVSKYSNTLECDILACYQLY